MLLELPLAPPARVVADEPLVRSSFSGRRWLWRLGTDRVGLGIAQLLELPEMVGRVMAARGIGLDDAADFLRPTLRALLPDPSVLRDMDRAAERLAHAVRRQETVAVFGDYDVDGACSGAALALALRALGATVIPYVPDRIAEGYGPNAPALLRLAARGAGLIVCVDCGTAADEALAAVAGRADVVVLDHHKSEHVPHAALATVNPNRLDCTSGLHGLCATAVVFLTIVAMVRVLRREGFFAQRPEPDLLGLLDLVALATVCDVMPLTGLNRAFVAQGLKVLGRGARPGIAALLAVARAGVPDAATCGFALGPRINAAGRISEADLGLRLLLCEDPGEAASLASALDAVNRQRQVVEADMLDAALLAAARQLEDGHATVLVSGAEWHAGVVGIVAGRIKERFNRPACVAGILGDTAKGSGRSVTGIDLGAAVIAARKHGILASGGGHAMAAGFALPAERLPDFHVLLNKHLAAAMALPTAPDLAIEGALTVAGATIDLAEQIARLGPFGHGHEEPVLVLRHARVAYAERIGAEGTTLRASIEGEGTGRLKAMMFRARDSAVAEALLTRTAPVHLAGRLRAETWNGSTTPTFFLTDAAAA